MHKALLFTLFLFVYSTGFGQCPATPIELNSQTDVDNFVLNYPNCTDLLDDLIIDGNIITNFKGLSSITSIAGRFRVANTQIDDFMGLEFLETVGGTLEIENNNSLVDLSGLESLTSVRRLFVLDNSTLKTLNGLDALITIEEEESIVIVDNSSLVSIDALDTVVICPNCWIDISNNPNLTNLFGLQNIAAGEIGIVFFRNNNNLVVCNLENICEFLNNGGDHIIENNASGCSSAAEIIANCIFSVSEEELSNEITLSPNPVSEALQIKIPQGVVLKKTAIYSVLGEEIFSASEADLDCSVLPGGIYFVTIDTSMGTVAKRSLKINNDLSGYVG